MTTHASLFPPLSPRAGCAARALAPLERGGHRRCRGRCGAAPGEEVRPRWTMGGVHRGGLHTRAPPLTAAARTCARWLRTRQSSSRWTPAASRPPPSCAPSRSCGAPRGCSRARRRRSLLLLRPPFVPRPPCRLYPCIPYTLRKEPPRTRLSPPLPLQPSQDTLHCGLYVSVQCVTADEYGACWRTRDTVSLT